MSLRCSGGGMGTVERAIVASALDMAPAPHVDAHFSLARPCVHDSGLFGGGAGHHGARSRGICL
eukprot:6216139-Alexandrium_andersonii.AAC.1